MIPKATISDDGLYRYDLTRTWTPAFEGSTAVWVMLNPSTADAETDDPTIRRVVAFSKAWGFGAAVVVNLFALRATRPVHLNDHPDPVGPRNDERAGFWIRHLPVVAAWGAHRKASDRMDWFGEQIRMSQYPVRCLGTTKGGYPRHPLYVPASQQPEPFVLPNSVGAE